MAASRTFSTIPHMGITSRGGRFPKYKTQSVVPAIWLVRRFFLFVWVLFIEKLGVLMTDKGGFL